MQSPRTVQRNRKRNSPCSNVGMFRSPLSRMLLSSHVTSDDALFCEAAKQDGFDIILISQPPNSPDLNVLDLGFFSSIQSIQYKTNAKTTEDLVAAVEKAFEDYSPLKANRILDPP